ncbi:MAG: lysylphosphatidylglycerol synthase domain-containing protein [Salinivirgaceae bacterium]|jgi:hypothetical protein|nr:lysylphosphatidylglycerol synthase domain-containing protein [Salinivirgaceae bacterium]
MKSPRKTLIFLVKAIVIAASYGFIAYRIFIDESFENILFLKPFEHNNVLFLLSAILLMPANWLLEATKWRYMLKSTERIPLIKAFWSVLAGISIAIFTPNRTGEYIGRIWILQQRNRLSGITITMAGSFAQSGITFFVGALCGWIWLTESPESEITNWQQVCIATIVTLLGLLFYLMLPQISDMLLRFKLHKYIRKALLGFKQLTVNVLFKTLLLSAARYLVFATQFVLLLHYFATGLTIGESLLGIGLLYAAMLVIPSITIAEPGIRGSLSLLIFGFFSTNSAGILGASLLLWIINLAVPAIMGTFHLATVKTLKP